MKRNDETNINQLKRDWRQLDELGEQSVSKVEVKELLHDYREKKRRTFYKELVIFLCTAFVILSSFAFSFVRAPGIFIVIQVGASLLPPIILFVLVKRKNKRGKTIL
ncbi:YxlC family protein [Niallia sp. Krafla_26]|uniref:YxlC family protein n=1 Tax=Niallia sp. Krafla_26 TaxID=3064703 RepID=UPI003D18625F